MSKITGGFALYSPSNLFHVVKSFQITSLFIEKKTQDFLFLASTLSLYANITFLPTHLSLNTGNIAHILVIVNSLTKNAYIFSAKYLYALYRVRRGTAE